MSNVIPLQRQWVSNNEEFQLKLKLASVLFKSGNMPICIKSLEQLAAWMSQAWAYDLNEMLAPKLFEENHFNKQIDLKTTTKVALIARAGGTVSTIEETDRKVTIEATRPGWKTQSFTYTWEDATKAGLVQKNSVYSKFPKDMLYARAVSRMSSRMFPDVILGIDGGDSFEERGAEGASTTESLANQLNQLVGKGPNDQSKRETPSIESGSDTGTVRAISGVGALDRAIFKPSSTEPGTNILEPITIKPRSTRRKSDEQIDTVGAALRADSEPIIASSAAVESNGDGLQGLGLRDSDSRGPDAREGRDTEEGRLRTGDDSIQGGSSEDKLSQSGRAQASRERISGRFPSATFKESFEESGVEAFDSNKEAHKEILSRVSKRQNLTPDFKRKWGAEIVKELVFIKVQAIEAEVEKALIDVVKACQAKEASKSQEASYGQV